MYDRFNLEEEIMNVWQTRDDLDAVTERIVEDTVFMNADHLSNVLIGLSFGVDERVSGKSVPLDKSP